MTPILLGLTTVLAMVYLYHARQNKVLKTDALLPSGQWSSHRITFLNFGLVFALGFVTMAFEMESAVPNYDREIIMELNPDVEMEVIRTAYPAPEELPPPPPPEEKVKPKFDILAPIDLVDDHEAVPELDLIEDTPLPAPENAKVVIAPPPPPKPIAPPPPSESDIVELWGIVEEMPRFPGCEDFSGDQSTCATKKMLEFIYDRVKYPTIARRNGIKGTAVVSFIVEKDGSITEAKVVRDPGGMTGEAALAVVRQFPKWIPGKQRGIPVRVQFNLPIRFDLRD